MTLQKLRDIMKVSTEYGQKGESMTNTNKLKARIVEKGFTMESLAQAVNLSCPTIRRKINGKQDFRVSGIKAFCRALSLDLTDVPAYFFSEDVHKTRTTV